jgi:hypothetical protein
VENNMAITLFIIGILLSISLCRFCKAVLFQLEIAKIIKDNLASATQSYCILGLVEELEEFQNKVCNLIDNLLDFNKTVKVALSFKKINLQCFLTEKQIDFLENEFFKNFKEDLEIIKEFL